MKTQHLKKSAYGAIDPIFIGRSDGHSISITSQSGSGAIHSVLKNAGLKISEDKMKNFQIEVKNYSDSLGQQLSDEQLISFFKQKVS